MMDIKVVIGAGFGDEGKGLMTDYLSSKAKNGIVVRFNGGAQAGHTVVTPEGHRHVFSHFGSGTLVGLPTYLSKHFIVNPILFMKEYKGLTKKGIEPKITIHPECLVTTPFDMIINQVVESYRSGKHGSCGMGINETVVRNNDGFTLTYYELLYRTDEYIRDFLMNIKKHHVIDRLKDLGVDAIPIDFIDVFSNSGIIDSFMEDIKQMREIAKGITTYGALKDYDTVIFEGAQGLMLDQFNMDYFPHLTRSSTGMKNVMETIQPLYKLIESVEIVYATRAYMTRHGQGRFDTEQTSKPYAKIVDMTNVPNPWQGTLRFGLVDIDNLARFIKNDLEQYVGSRISYSQSLAVTCLDQLDDSKFLRYFSSGVETQTHVRNFIDLLSRRINPSKMYLSYGMTRETIKETC